MADLHEQQYLRITSCFGRRVVERESGKEREGEGANRGPLSRLCPFLMNMCESVVGSMDGFPLAIFACENTHLLLQIVSSSFPLSSAGPFVVPCGQEGRSPLKQTSDFLFLPHRSSTVNHA